MIYLVFTWFHILASNTVNRLEMISLYPSFSKRNFPSTAIGFTAIIGSIDALWSAQEGRLSFIGDCLFICLGRKKNGKTAGGNRRANVPAERTKKIFTFTSLSTAALVKNENRIARAAIESNQRRAGRISNGHWIAESIGSKLGTIHQVGGGVTVPKLSRPINQNAINANWWDFPRERSITPTASPS